MSISIESGSEDLSRSLSALGDEINELFSEQIIAVETVDDAQIDFLCFRRDSTLYLVKRRAGASERLTNDGLIPELMSPQDNLPYDDDLHDAAYSVWAFHETDSDTYHVEFTEFSAAEYNGDVDQHIFRLRSDGQEDTITRKAAREFDARLAESMKIAVADKENHEIVDIDSDELPSFLRQYINSSVELSQESSLIRPEDRHDESTRKTIQSVRNMARDFLDEATDAKEPEYRLLPIGDQRLLVTRERMRAGFRSIYPYANDDRFQFAVISESIEAGGYRIETTATLLIEPDENMHFDEVTRVFDADGRKVLSQLEQRVLGLLSDQSIDIIERMKQIDTLTAEAQDLNDLVAPSTKETLAFLHRVKGLLEAA